MEILSAIIQLLGGLAMFLYGIELMGDGLKNSSGAVLKRVLEKVTGNVLMSNRLPLGSCSLCRTDVHTTIYLHRVAGDYLTVKRPCKSNRQSGLARRRRSGYCESEYHLVTSSSHLIRSEKTSSLLVSIKSS